MNFYNLVLDPLVFVKNKKRINELNKYCEIGCFVDLTADGEPESFEEVKGHVICEKFIIRENEPLELFGTKCVLENIPWLDMRNCSGILSPETFSLIPDIKFITMFHCEFEKNGPNIFAPLENLQSLEVQNKSFPSDKEIFEGSKMIEGVRLLFFKKIDSDYLFYLKDLQTVSIYSSEFEEINFSGLTNLKHLRIKSCVIRSVARKSFEDLINLETLVFARNMIDEFDPKFPSNMKNLKRLKLYRVVPTDSVFDFEIFKQLPMFESGAFNSNIYQFANFTGFPKLRTVEFGIYTSPHHLAEDVIKSMATLNIIYKKVFSGIVNVKNHLIDEPTE